MLLFWRVIYIYYTGRILTRIIILMPRSLLHVKLSRKSRGGGGGVVLPYICILGMCRARDPHFQPWISVPEHIIFTNYQKIRSGASPYYILADFAVPETIIFKISLISTRSSPPTLTAGCVRQRRGLAAVPEIRIFTLKTDQARSGAPQFHAQNGSSSCRRPAFSRSTGSSFRSPCPFFTLPRHIPTKIWGEYPPPPPPRA